LCGIGVDQRIYRGGIPTGLVPVHLDRNLRNTRTIHALAQHFYQGDAMEASGPAGRAVEFVEAEGPQAIGRRLSQVVHRLVHDEAVAPCDIAVLTGRAAAKTSVGKDGKIGVYRCTRDQHVDPGAVLVETVHRFKGLERPVVILVELDDYVARSSQELLYVGVSRARAHLIIIGSRATLGALRQ
jgi:DNA helicase IV